MNVSCIPNTVYVFRCLVSFEGLMAQPDLNNLVKFNIPNSMEQMYLLRLLIK